eukprot:scaffold63671_cov60-Phaeocystis_antarctica.AAC.2
MLIPASLRQCGRRGHNNPDQPHSARPLARVQFGWSAANLNTLIRTKSNLTVAQRLIEGARCALPCTRTRDPRGRSGPAASPAAHARRTFPRKAGDSTSRGHHSQHR